jgi:hypothetical protein
MSVTTRVVCALSVLALAAIPVAALTQRGTSTNVTTVAIESAPETTAGNIPAEEQANAGDCGSACGDTGTEGNSQLLNQNATIETGGLPFVSTAAPVSQRLVPQNPVADVNDETNGSVTAPVAKAEPAERPARQRKYRKQAQKGGSPGSFELLFDGKK